MMAHGPCGGVSGARRVKFDRPLPVKLACQSCRSGHQKCDGALPVCSRCKKEQKICDYTPSRRGHAVAHLHKRSLNPSKSHVRNYSSEMSLQVPLVATTTKPSEMISRSPSHEPFEDSALIRVTAEQDLNVVLAPYPTEKTSTFNPYYLSVFYSRFWPAHPFLPPFTFIEEHLNINGGDALRSIATFIGFKYSGESWDCPVELESPRGSVEYSQSGISVQTLVLSAISHHMTNDREKAQLALDAAVRIALTIGLDKKSYASDHGGGVSAVEESRRRTWWELFILDVMFAALNQTGFFCLNDVQLEVLLPCEESVYRANNILPEPQSLRGFDSRFFMDDEIRYSSFSYRIAAARTLRKVVLVTGSQEPVELSPMREVDLELENLMLHLPGHLQTYVDNDGIVDEVAFQTHMIINAGNIYLHSPQSLLASLNPKHTIACAPNNATVHSLSIHHHTRKTVDAADEICRMTSPSSALVTHTPFFICAVAMQAIVHLGIYRLPMWSSKRKLMEEQIKMSIGALRKFSEVWEITSTVK